MTQSGRSLRQLIRCLRGIEIIKSIHIKYVVVVAILVATSVWLIAKDHSDHAIPHRAVVDKPTITVLPFLADSPGDISARLAAQITSDLTNELSRSPRFRVMSEPILPAIRERQLSIRELGESLAVSHFVKGGVRETRGQVLISIQLIDARSEEHVWAETYQIDGEDFSSFTASVEAEISSKF